MHFGKISVSDLRLLLDFWSPSLDAEIREMKADIAEKSAKYSASGGTNIQWAHLYELSIRQHLKIASDILGLEPVFVAAAGSNTPIKSLFESADSITDQLEKSIPPSASKEDYLALYSGACALTLSSYGAMRSLVVWGRYLNNLIADIRDGNDPDDKWFMKAVRIDQAVLACPSVARRLHRASAEGDDAFFRKLARALNGLSSAKDREYEQRRLVLQILYESGTKALTDSQLYTLFVEGLKIVQADKDGDIGDVANNLRQFDYQFRKQMSVS